MTQDERNLLLKDLTARLSCGIKIQFNFNKAVYVLEGINTSTSTVTFNRCITCYIDSVKPYLFPMSSMTEEQKKEYNYWKHDVPICHYEYGDVIEEQELLESPESFNYLIENHFDYYGLIPKGLAIDATGLNIY